MTDIFSPIVKWLESLGFYNFFFPWIVVLAIMYAILKKSKILGESVVVNGVVALAIAFFVFGFPVIAGVNLSTPFVTLFTQTTAILLFLIIGFILASLFYPDLPRFLVEAFTRRTTLWTMIALGITLFVTSGMVGTFWITKPPEPGKPAVPTDIIIIATGVILAVVIILIAASTVRMGA